MAGIAMVFPGQGAYRAGVLQPLVRQWGDVAATFGEIDDTCREEGEPEVFDWALGLDAESASDLVRSAPDRLQVLLFGLGVAVFRAARARGTLPSLLLGHSLGEIAALCCAGVYTLPDATRLVLARNRALREASTVPGAMMVVTASERSAAALVDLTADASLQVACVNGPSQCVLSGSLEALARVQKLTDALEIATQALAAPYAFHNQILAPAAEAFCSMIEGLRPRPAVVEVFSPILGRRYTDADDLPVLLSRQLVRPVRFADAVRQACAAGVDTFVECGLGTSLGSLVQQIDPLAIVHAPAVVAIAGNPQPTPTWADVPVREETEEKQKGTPTAPVATGPAPAATVDETVTTELLDPTVGADDLSRIHVTTKLAAMYASALGYPAEAFTWEAELEGELGIDSITQTDLLLRVASAYGFAPDSTAVARTHTFGDVVTWAMGRVGSAAGAS